MYAKYTIDDMNELASRRKGECLSKRYTNKSTKLKWRCEKGHEWKATPANVRQGTWCPTCGHKKLTISEFKEIARSRGGKCLSRQYVNNYSKLQWRCAKGHEWLATPATVKHGTWCPICARFAQNRRKGKLTIDALREIAESKGGSCLSKRFLNNHSKLKWRCKQDHEWKASADSVKRGRWCPMCGHKTLSLDEFQLIAKKRGGSCVSKKYVNAKTKLSFRCRDGHEWKATPDHIKRGSWCPRCARLKKS